MVLPSALWEARFFCCLPLNTPGKLACELLERLQALPTIPPQKPWAYSHTLPPLTSQGLWRFKLRPSCLWSKPLTHSAISPASGMLF